MTKDTDEIHETNVPGQADGATDPGPGARRYEGAFTIDSWDQHDTDPVEGFSRSRAEVAKTFSGDLTGTSRTELLLAGTDGGSRAYCGFEQFTGSVAGRTGSFALRHAAVGDAGGGWMTWQVLPGSGTGELSGVLGEGQITRLDDGSHTYWLELTLP